MKKGHFQYANELVQYIREKSGDDFNIGVAAYPEYHPEAQSPEQDLRHFVAKAKAGADYAITQYFFNPDAYFFFVDSCLEKGISIPIIPGIMPITNYKQLVRFSKQCGTDIPRWILERLKSYDERGDMMSIREFGEQVVSLMCETLLNNGAPGLHFYTLNRFEPSHHILQNLVLAEMKRQ